MLTIQLNWIISTDSVWSADSGGWRSLLPGIVVTTGALLLSITILYWSVSQISHGITCINCSWRDLLPAVDQFPRLLCLVLSHWSGDRKLVSAPSQSTPAPTSSPSTSSPLSVVTMLPWTVDPSEQSPPLRRTRHLWSTTCTGHNTWDRGWSAGWSSLPDHCSPVIGWYYQILSCDWLIILNTELSLVNNVKYWAVIGL